MHFSYMVKSTNYGDRDGISAIICKDASWWSQPQDRKCLDKLEHYKYHMMQHRSNSHESFQNFMSKHVKPQRKDTTDVF
jgi:hypothetical protein